MNTLSKENRIAAHRELMIQRRKRQKQRIGVKPESFRAALQQNLEKRKAADKLLIYQQWLDARPEVLKPSEGI